MLDQLRSVLGSKGRITGALIDQSASLRKNSSFFKRFGGLRRAYEKLGYTPQHNLSFLESNTARKALHAKLLNDLLSNLKANGAVIEMFPKIGTLKVNGDFTLRLIVTRCLRSPDGRVRWWIPKRSSSGCDLTIVARMNDDNTRILDHFLLPANEHPHKRVLVTSEIPFVLDVYRFETLEPVYRICRRKLIGVSL